MPFLGALGAIGAIGQAGAGIAGAIGASNARGEAKQAAQAAFAELEKLGIPPEQAAPIVFQQLQQQGLLDPELEQAINAGVSQVSQIQENPDLAKAQMGALEQLKSVSAGGLRPEDRAAYNEFRRNAQREAEAKRQQILQNYQARGMGGSGMELAAQLSAAQSGDENLSAQGDQLAAAASQRALQAINQMGGLAGQIRGQDFGVNQARAQAADAMKQFDVQNQIGQQARNVAQKNAAAQYNLGEKQRVADTNVGIGNTELLRQRMGQQQDWQNKMGLASAKANALNQQAAQSREDASAIGKSAGDIGAGIGGIFGDLGVQKERSDFMGSLTPDEKKSFLYNEYLKKK